MTPTISSLPRLLLLLLILIGLGVTAMKSQPVPCTTDSLVINTGWDYSINGVGSVGNYTSAWQITADPSPGTTEPRPAALIAPYSTWGGPLPGSTWISAYPSATNDTNGTYVLEYCFCIVERTKQVWINFDILADDRATIYLNGTQIGMTVPAFAFLLDSMTTVNRNVTNLVQQGKNCITIKLQNTNSVAMGLDIRGSITASGIALEDPTCCSDSTAGLTGTKFEDLDCDGIHDLGEPPLSGVQIVLSNGATTTTDNLGNYYFNGLTSGTYVVSENPSAPWVQTYPTPPNHTVSLSNGQVVGNLDFGNCDTSRKGGCIEIRNDTTTCMNDGTLQVTAQFEIRSLMGCPSQQSATFVSLDPNVTIFPGNAPVTSNWSQVNLLLSGPGVVQGATAPIEVTVCCYALPGVPPVCCTDTIDIYISCGTPQPCLELIDQKIECAVDDAGNQFYNYQVHLDALLPCPNSTLQGTFTVISPTPGVTVSPATQVINTTPTTYGMVISGPSATPGTMVGIEVKLCCFDPAIHTETCCRDTLWITLPECPKEECKDCCKDFPKQVLPLQWSFGNGTSIVGGWMWAGNTKICTVSATLVDATINGQPVAGTFVAPANLGGTPGTIPFRHEVIWSGVDVNAGPTLFNLRIQFPSVATPPGRDRIRYCIRFRFTDENCVTCDTVICFSQRRWRWFFFDRGNDSNNETSVAPGLSEQAYGWSLHPQSVLLADGYSAAQIDELSLVPLTLSADKSTKEVVVRLRGSAPGSIVDGQEFVVSWQDVVSTDALPEMGKIQSAKGAGIERTFGIAALFPDPTDKKITIIVDDDRNGGDLVLIITDITGQEVLRISDAMPSAAAGGRVVIDTDNLETGTYHCTIQSGGKSATQSFRVVH